MSGRLCGALLFGTLMVALGATCTATNPEYCLDDTACGKDRWCDVAFNACRDIEDGGSDGGRDDGSGDKGDGRH